jgi:hypothetical protein
MATGEISIEAWVAPANTTQSGPAQIAAIAKNAYKSNLLLGQGQWGTQRADRYVARLRSTDDDDDDDAPYLSSPRGWPTLALPRPTLHKPSSWRNSALRSRGRISA